MTDATPQEIWFENDGLKLRAVQWGKTNAPAIIMLHGLRSYGHTWEPVAQPLLPRWQVLALDQRGRGASDWDVHRKYFTEAYVSDIEALVARASLGKFVLLGHSMGGATSIVYAARHPDKVAALVVEDNGPGASGDTKGAERIKQELQSTPKSFATWAEAAAFWRKIRPGVSEEALASRVTYSLKQAADGRVTWRYDAEGIAEARLAPEAYTELWPHVEALAMPTLLLRGARSDFLKPETASQMCRRNPRITWVDVPDASHYVHDDNLAGFNTALQSFLARVATA